MKFRLASFLLVAPFTLFAQTKKSEVLARVDATKAVFDDIALKIWNYAEVGFQETKSSALLQSKLTQEGFKVESGVAGMPTAFVASFGSGAGGILMLLGVIIGGRLGYVLFYNPSLIWSRPLEILQVWHGGMSFHGGFLGVCAAVILYARSQKIDLLRLGDLIAPAGPVGLLFGRIANFINGELWGRETQGPWGMIFCNAKVQELNDGS